MKSNFIKGLNAVAQELTVILFISPFLKQQLPNQQQLLGIDHTSTYECFKAAPLFRDRKPKI